jgi:hypothetical protein
VNQAGKIVNASAQINYWLILRQVSPAKLFLTLSMLLSNV